jgi:hypothetical protein
MAEQKWLLEGARLTSHRHRLPGWHWPVRRVGHDCRWVCLLRDQAMVCQSCGELLSAGHKALLPTPMAEGLVQIGDAIIVEPMYWPI